LYFQIEFPEAAKPLLKQKARFSPDSEIEVVDFDLSRFDASSWGLGVTHC
jgi:hypothetical protein